MARKKKFENSKKVKKVSYLSSQVLPSKELIDSCKFNFYLLTEDPDVVESTVSYWETQKYFSKHLSKFKSFAKESLSVLDSDSAYSSIYKYLRNKSDQPPSASLRMPDRVPTEAKWYEFHLGGLQRVIGFVMPGEFHGDYFPGVNSRFTVDREN